MVEKVRFEGDAEDLTRTLDIVSRKFAELAQQENAVVTASARINKAGDAFNQLRGTIVTTTSAGAKLVQSIKLNRKEFEAVATGAKTLDQAIAGATKRYALNTNAVQANNKALMEQQRLEAEIGRQFQAGAAVASETSRRREARGGQGPTPSTRESLNFATAEDQVKRLARTTKVTGDQIRKIFRDASRGEIRDYGEEVNRVRNAIFRLVKAEREFGNEAKRAADKARTAQASAGEQTKSNITSTQRLIKTIKGFARVGAVSLFVGALFELQQAFRKAIVAAGELTIKIAEIETIQGDAVLTTAVWTSELRRLSDTFGLDILDQAEAAYQTLSTQIAKGTDATQFLTTANKLAAAGVTDVANSVRLTATLLNAYGKDANQAADISGKLFKTVELGVVRIEQLAQGFGRISVPAAKLGIRLEELLAAVAQTTRQGVQFNEAATLIRGIIQKTIQPTDELKKVLNELGFASGEAAIQTLGFGGFVAALDKRTQGSSTELGKLFSRVRAITGGLIVAGEGVNTFNRTLADIDASGVETLEKASARIQATLGKRFARVTQQIKNFFLVDVGPPVLKVLLDITEGLISFSKQVNAFFKVLTQNRGVVIAFQGVLTGLAVLTLPTVVAGLQTAIIATLSYAKALGVAALAASRAAIAFLAANPVLAGFAAIAAAAVVTYQLTAEALKEDERAADDFTAAITRSTAELRKQRTALQELTNEEIIKGIRERNQEVRKSISEENKAIAEANRLRLTSLKTVRDETESINKALIDSLKKRVSQARNEFKKFSDGVEKTASDISKAFNAASRELFSFDISIAADQTQIRLIENQLLGLEEQQRQAAEEGDKARFERVSGQIRALNKQRFDALTRLNKARRKADQDIFTARADLVRAEGEGDRERVQAARDRLNDAKEARRVIGTANQEQLDVQRQIAQTRRDLSRASFRSPEAEALKVQLEGLRRLQTQVGQQNQEERKQREKLVSIFEMERDLRLKLADELAKKAEEAFKRQLQQQIVLAELTDLEKKRRDFNLEGLIKKGDQKAIREGALEQLRALERISKLQEELGLDADRRRKTEQEIFLLRKTASEELLRAGNNQLLTDVRNIEEKSQVELKEARKIANEQNKLALDRIDNLRGSLTETRKQIQSLTPEQLRIVFATETEAGGRLEGNTLTKRLDDLLRKLDDEAQRPGTVDFGDDFQGLVEQLASATVRGTLEGPDRFQGEQLLEGIKGNLDVAGRSLGGQVAFLQAQLADAQRRQIDGQKGADQLVKELERRLKARVAAEAAGAAQSEKNISGLVREVQARESAIIQLNNSFDRELATIKARITASQERFRQEKGFDTVIGRITNRLQKLQSDISDLDFQKALVRAAEKEAQGTLVDPGTQRTQQTPQDTLKQTLDLAGNDIIRNRINAEKAAQPTAIDTAKEAERAKRPIAIDTAKIAAREGVKIRVEEERKLAEGRKKAAEQARSDAERLRKQQANQRKIAESGQGLTGFAQRVAEADERARQRQSGEFGPSAQRRREAEARAAQRKRNEDFLRERRERLNREADAARGRERDAAGRTAPAATLQQQLQRQLQQAQRQATTDPTAENKRAVEVLTNELKALRQVEEQNRTSAERLRSEALKTGVQREQQITGSGVAPEDRLTQPVALLDDAEPLRLLTNALNGNTQALKDLAFRSAIPGTTPRTPAEFGNITPNINTQRLPSPFRPEPFGAEDGGVITPPVFKPNVNVSVQLDGKDVASKVTTTVDRNLARRGRQGTSRSQR